MKSILQGGALVAVLVGGVFGLTFLTQYTRKPAPPPDNIDIKPTVRPLVIRENVGVWDPNDPDYTREVEKGGKGHYDFWVSNPNPKPVAVAVISKSCTCAEVHIGLIPPPTWLDIRRQQAALATALHLVGAPDWAVPLPLAPLPGIVKWQRLLYDRNEPPHPVPIPPADPQAGPQFAIVRLGWNAKEPKAMRLVAEVQQQYEATQETTKFEVPVVIVNPILESNNNLSFGDLH